VFVALRDNMRRCLVCERVFTRQAAAEHALTPCYPASHAYITEEACLEGLYFVPDGKRACKIDFSSAHDAPQLPA
jgi:hypothetical protein